MIVQNELTSGVNVITHIGNGKILRGHKSGIISLWQYFRPETLQHIRNYTSNENGIRFIIPFLENKFISLDERSVIRVWEISSGTCEAILHGGSVYAIDCAVVLPNNLLVVSGYQSPAWECFDVWDLESEVCIYRKQLFCHRPHGMSLATTAQGFLVASGLCEREVSVWQIDRLECKVISKGEIGRIYSMAMLPTGDIVTGNHSVDFYKISYDRGIYKYKTLENGNVIDEIYPIGGYKFLVIDRSGACSGTMKLWNYLSEEYERLGTSVVGVEVSSGHILLERESTILSLGKDKIVIHEFSEGIFHFPKEIAEIRKNSRILSQAYRTGTSFFANLPEEINLKIVALTYENMKQCEKRLCEKIAQNYFSRPLAAITNQNSKKIIDGDASCNTPSKDSPKI